MVQILCAYVCKWKTKGRFSYSNIGDFKCYSHQQIDHLDKERSTKKLQSYALP
jgi:hypothetical protein